MDEALYRDFAELEDSHWWFRGRRAVIRQVLRKKLPFVQSRQILDVGCGTGAMLPLLQEFGEVEGLESSEAGLSYCRARLGAGVQLHAGELPGGLPQGKKYDLVTAFDVIEHLPDPVTALRALGRILAPRGTLMVTVPAYMFLWSEHDEVNHHHRRYTQSLLRQHLKEGGWETTFSSYFNAALLPPIGAVRWGQKILPRALRVGSHGSDLARTPALANWLLSALFSAERWVVPRFPLPFGVSLLALAKAASVG